MISICMTYFNRKKQLFKTIDSINESQVKDYEIIIVDDASDDEHKLNSDELKERSKGNVILLEIDKNKKTWYNGCIAYNISFAAASGDKIIIQNPEVYHLGDILDHVDKHLINQTYLTYQVIAPSELVSNRIYEFKNIEEISQYMSSIIQKTHHIQGNPYTGNTIWYNHVKYRPVYYHFISAITKENLFKLGGFDERYQTDHSFDDNEFLIRLNRLKLQKTIISNPMAIHMYHPVFFNASPLYGSFNYNLYHNITLKENIVKLKDLNFNNYTQYLK